MSARRGAQALARLARFLAKTVACIRNVLTSVGRLASLALKSANGNALISSVASCVVNCAIAQDVTGPARSSSNVERTVVAIAVEVCVESNVFVLCA